MCGSHSNGNDCCCCPNAEIFKEELCGNFQAINEAVWTAPAVNDYIQGTFEVFNAGPGPALFTVNNGTVISVPPGNSQVLSVNNPSIFIVQTIDFPGEVAGTHGKWCITLYKRVFV